MRADADNEVGVDRRTGAATAATALPSRTGAPDARRPRGTAARGVRHAVALAAAVAAVWGMAPAATAAAVSASQPGLVGIRDAVAGTLSGRRALEYTAYPYLGWRTNGGPWFNACLDWLAGRLKSFGFREGKNARGPRYWFQTDVFDGHIWMPQYASLEIVGPRGDPVPGQDYHFDFAVATFDPTSPYYPAGVTYSWLKRNIGTPAEAALNERCHLAQNSPFTSPAGTPPAAAQAAARTGELVDVGVVTRVDGRYVWSKNTDVDLAGKFIYAAYDARTGRGTSRGSLWGLAVQENAAGSLSPQLNAYNNPVIDGRELFPDAVQFGGVSNWRQNGPLAFNISPQDARYLEGLLAGSGGPVLLRGVAVGSFGRISHATPLRTLVAEIPGKGPSAGERVVMMAHAQEPGACDNATGVGLQLEIARTLRKLLKAGKLPPARRTFTFIWGSEGTMGDLWKAHDPVAFSRTKAALVLDMVGEDPARTGGSLRIEKMPDPSAVYQYGLDTLPGQVPEPPAAFVRRPDKHTLWGAGEVELWPYPGHYLNDLYLRSAELAQAISPRFEVGSNPWEGGSDHDTFLWNKDRGAWNPKPAVLAWHFTDYVYHSSKDTLGMVSARELRDVGRMTAMASYLIAAAGERQATQIMRIVERGARRRFAWERLNSAGSLQWAYDRAAAGGGSPAEIRAAVEAELARETETLNAWGLWYRQAVKGARQLVGGKPTKAYLRAESDILRAMQRRTDAAVANARAIAGRLVGGL